MAVYKRGNVWWYEFTFSGVRVRDTTQQTNKRTAGQIAAARKTQLAKGEVGIPEQTQAPTLLKFSERFMEAIETQCAKKPGDGVVLPLQALLSAQIEPREGATGLNPGGFNRRV